MVYVSILTFYSPTGYGGNNGTLLSAQTQAPRFVFYFLHIVGSRGSLFLKRIRSFVRERFIRYWDLLFELEGRQFVEADVRARVAFFEQDVDHLFDRCDVPFA